MAIARDTSTSASGAPTSSPGTWSHTCTGSNLILFVGVESTGASDNVTGATYNGVAMTLVQKQARLDGREVYLFVLVNPATGSNTVSVSWTGTDGHFLSAISYTGAAQNNQIPLPNQAMWHLTG